MRSPTSTVRPSMSYPQQTLLRAERAMRCSPFNLTLFEDMQEQSVALQAIAGSSGVQRNYTQTPLPERVVESHLLWLIQVGLLRREVDGQGLTDCFRLTPLGRQLIEQGQTTGSYTQGQTPQDQDPNQSRWLALSWKDYALNFISRWLRTPLI